MSMTREPDLRWNIFEMTSDRDVSFTDEAVWFPGITQSLVFWDQAGNPQKEDRPGVRYLGVPKGSAAISNQMCFLNIPRMCHRFVFLPTVASRHWFPQARAWGRSLFVATLGSEWRSGCQRPRQYSPSGVCCLLERLTFHWYERKCHFKVCHLSLPQFSSCWYERFGLNCIWSTCVSTTMTLDYTK